MPCSVSSRPIRTPFPVTLTTTLSASAGCMRLEFPDLRRAIDRKIAQRKKTEMNRKGEILKAALEGDPPLTAEQMAGRLGFGCPGVLRRSFPAQYQALLAKTMNFEEAQRKQLRSDLISALAENPAPTVFAVCARLGVSSSRVYFLNRDLAHEIAARHFGQARRIIGSAARTVVKPRHFFLEPRDSRVAAACFRRSPALPCARTLPFLARRSGSGLPARGAAGFVLVVVAVPNPPSGPAS